jgi:hypothetical protein
VDAIIFNTVPECIEIESPNNIIDNSFTFIIYSIKYDTLFAYKIGKVVADKYTFKLRGISYEKSEDI